jgi:hypothetical protein
MFFRHLIIVAKDTASDGVAELGDPRCAPAHLCRRKVAAQSLAGQDRMSEIDGPFQIATTKA